ncbi:hypothetical protein ACIPRD_11295 [Streptomyces sp. NPDC090108]|uniref:hypothetical protein n=1 Tax=Streptomyces sp. NPDC090108 TaxID=3365947 RepID=UPI00381920FA
MAERQQNLEMEHVELRAAAEDRRTAQAKRIRMVAAKAGASTDRQGAATPDEHWVVTMMNNTNSPVRHGSTSTGKGGVSPWSRR